VQFVGNKLIYSYNVRFFWCEKYRTNAKRRSFDQTSALRRYDGNRVSSDDRAVQRKHVAELH